MTYLTHGYIELDSVISLLLQRYNPKDAREFEQALREIVQHLALLGLWRSKFFEQAAFYGGTALRILHGLQRFSEDLDFSLISPNIGFRWEQFLGAVKEELIASGLEVAVETKKKINGSNIESAFIKANTLINLVSASVPALITNKFHRNRVLKIKFEIDTDPPSDAHYEVRNLLIPIPFQVRLYSLPDLFAGKVHALLCRQWKGRVKGRDYYDFIWFIGHDVPVRLIHLENRLAQTGHWNNSNHLDHSTLIALVVKKINEVNFVQAKNDVLPFVKDAQSLDLWTTDFFIALAKQIKSI